MKIGMILDKEFPPDPRVENEAVSLTTYGHEVHLYCFNFKKEGLSFEEINGIKVHRFKQPKFLRSVSALAYSAPLYHLFTYFSIKKFLKTTHVDAIHIHDMQIARAVFWLNRNNKKKITLDLHENRPEIMKFYKHVKSRIGRFLISPKTWKNQEAKLIKLSDEVIVVTKSAKDYYSKLAGVSKDKLHVVPNTVRKSFYKNYTLDNEIIEKYKKCFTLLYIGNTGRRRGLLTVLNSIKSIRKKITNIKVLIVGNSSEDHLLTEFIRTNQLEKEVDMVGWQDPSKFQSYILGSKIGLCPLHKNLHHDTTYANKIFQYMSLGKPVIVSNCTAQAEVINMYECGLVFTDRDSEDFEQKVMKMTKDNIYQKFSTNAKVAIEKHLNWEIKSLELQKIYG